MATAAKGVAGLGKANPSLLHLLGQPVVLIQTDSGGERKVRADANEQRSPFAILDIEVILLHPAVFGFQMPLFSGTDGSHNAGGFARLDDHRHLVGLHLRKIGLDEFVAPTFWVLYDFRLPGLSAVLNPVVILARHLPQEVPAHGINLPIHPEKALRSGTVQEGLNTAI